MGCPPSLIIFRKAFFDSTPPVFWATGFDEDPNRMYQKSGGAESASRFDFLNQNLRSYDSPGSKEKEIKRKKGIGKEAKVAIQI
jgi:hypothetical protein